MEKSPNRAGSAPAMFRFIVILSVLTMLSLVVYAGLWPALPRDLLQAIQGAEAEGIPLEINHQGVVSVNGKKFTGTGDFRFALFDPDTDTNLWTNDGTNVGGSGMPVAAVAIDVDKGDYSVRLGNTGLPNMVEIPTSVFEDDNVVLRIWFDDRKHGVEQLTPDHVLTSAPYAYRAADATRADHAATADDAAHAAEADHAAAADEADHATTADEADHATEADHAATADDAAHAAEADHAVTADKLKKPEVPPGGIIMWSGTIADIPEGWVLCDGDNGTPDLRDRFIVGARQDDGGVAKTNVKGTLDVIGGEPEHRLTIAELPAHRHSDESSGGPGVAHQGSDGCIGVRPTQTGLTGGDQPHENCPPFYALAFIMKLPDPG